MSEDVKGDEPTIWEVYRGIERVEKAVHDMATNSVSAAVFAVEKQALHTRIDLLVQEHVALKAAQLANETALTNYAKEQEMQKGRNRLFVYGLVATPFVAGVVLFLLNGGLKLSGA